MSANEVQEKKNEITPEMVRAGAAILSDRFEIGDGLAEIIAMEVLKASLSANDQSAQQNR